jgi:acetyl-CoA synthetase
MENDPSSSPETLHPTPEVIERANVTAVARQLHLSGYPALHRWSVENRPAYWALVVERLGVRFTNPPATIVDAADPIHPRWLAGATMNIVDSCFLADPKLPAIIESDGSAPQRIWTGDELKRLTARVANGLTAHGIAPGDTVGVVMPMTARAVAIYLGIIAAGAAVVSIADSFSADEIATRLRLANAKMLFTQDVVAWGSKRLGLYEKITAAAAPMAVVSLLDDEHPCPLRTGDVAFDAYVSPDEKLAPVACAPQDTINILFSSGTTGQPKAIPWDHTTPIKCAADAHFHQDIHSGDIACWPSGLGWMMGPWLIFAALMNRATMALWAQSPADARFGKFVQDAGVTMLGTVPSLVRTWRQSECMAGVDWTKIRTLSSTGECSNPADTSWLMKLAGNRPMIEYCGGTEIGGAYVTSTVVQPCIPSTFTTPALGLDFVLLDEDRQPADKGEVFIEGPSIGLSNRLLNGNHDAIYYRDTPMAKSGIPLRRHGDELQALGGGYFRVAGRSDDTMNLGGIKVGCAEIERVLNPLPGIQETAAVAVAPRGGGPSRLIVFVVPAPGSGASAEELKPIFQRAISTQLNPLFHVHDVRIAQTLPRTASNKIMRRELRKSITG